MPDARVFEELLKAKLSLGYELELIETVETLISKNASRFTNGDPKNFCHVLP